MTITEGDAEVKAAAASSAGGEATVAAVLVLVVVQHLVRLAQQLAVGRGAGLGLRPPVGRLGVGLVAPAHLRLTRLHTLKYNDIPFLYFI